MPSYTVTNTYTVKKISTRDGYYPSGWLLFCSRTLVWYKEHLSAWYFQRKSPDTLHKYKNVQKHHAVVLKFLIFWCRVTLEPLDGKTSFQSHIVEQHKSYRMVVESWELVQANQNVPLFYARHFLWALANSMHKKRLPCDQSGNNWKWLLGGLWPQLWI